MANQFFVWLGSGRARKHDVSDKGKLLDKAAKAGLPVASGGILLDDFYRLCVQEQVIVVENGRFTCPAPQQLHTLLYNDIHFPKLDHPTAVRALFAAPPQLNCNVTNPQHLSHALCTLWSAIRLEPDTVRRDILLMKMVTADKWGTAVSHPHNPADQTTYPSSNGSSNLTLTKLTFWQTPDKSIPLYAQRLQMLLRGIRRTLGQAAWQIEWLDDGHICWLMQVTRLTDR